MWRAPRGCTTQRADGSASSSVPAPPDQDRLQQLLSFSVAEEVNEGYAAMLMEETEFRNRDLAWQPDLDAKVKAHLSKYPARL